jgi:hypothetical protein
VLLSKQSQYQILLKSHLESVDTLLLICAHGAASGDGFCPRAPRIDLIKNSSYDPLYRSTAAHNLPALGCKVGSQEPSDPSFDIAGGGDELVLEIDLCKALVAGSTQSVAAYELTYGPLNRVALAHLVPKFFALLIAPSLLEHFVIGSYQDRATESDDAGLPATLQKQEALGMEAPKELYTDGAYMLSSRDFAAKLRN